MISGRACAKPPQHYGVLLIADEVQTGMGRTGKLWGVDHWDVAPDILAVAKSLGGGVMPIGAVCSTEEIWQPMMYPNPFIQTTTTGGGALACSAAIAAINVTLRDRLWEQAAAKGEYMIPKLRSAGGKAIPQIFAGITGKGLLIGMHFHDAAGGLQGGGRVVQARRAGGRHADQRPHHPHRAAADHRLRTAGCGVRPTGGYA